MNEDEGTSQGHFEQSQATGEGPGNEQLSSEDRMMGMLCHLLGIFTSFVGPLIIWLVKKDQSPFVDDQGKEALNFQLTLLIGYLISAALACVFIGVFTAAALSIVAIIFGIMGTLDANNGKRYRYPFNIRFIS